MSKRLAVANTAAELSKKCFHCGLRNFAASTRCGRCAHDVWLSLPEQKADNVQLFESSHETGRLRASVLSAVLLLGLAFFLYLRQDSPGTAGAVSEAAVVQPATQQTVQPEQVTARENLQSQDAAKHTLAGLELFRRRTETNLSYDEYERALTQLKADLSNTLPLFVDHKSSDETFRREVDAAVRDYTAAGSWWKTVERNRSVLTEADRTERLVANWTSAKTHLDNAVNMLGR